MLTADPSTVVRRQLQSALAAALGGGVRTPGGIGTAQAPLTVPSITPNSRTFMGPPGGAAGGSAGGGGGSGSPYDTNPGYLAALAAEQSGSQEADAAFRAAQERALVGYGDSSLAAALGFEADPNTQAAARQNYLSGNAILARIDRQRDLSEQQNVNNLAAHGIINSGELGYQTGQIEQQRGRNIYDAQQQLLESIAQARAQDVAVKQALHQRVVDALMGAYDTYVSNPGLFGGAAGAAGAAPAASPSAAGRYSITGPTTPTPPTTAAVPKPPPGPRPATKPSSRFYRPPQIH